MHKPLGTAKFLSTTVRHTDDINVVGNVPVTAEPIDVEHHASSRGRPVCNASRAASLSVSGPNCSSRTCLPTCVRTRSCDDSGVRYQACMISERLHSPQLCTSVKVSDCLERLAVTCKAIKQHYSFRLALKTFWRRCVTLCRPSGPRWPCIEFRRGCACVNPQQHDCRCTQKQHPYPVYSHRHHLRLPPSGCMAAREFALVTRAGTLKLASSMRTRASRTQTTSLLCRDHIETSGHNGIN